jgi:outer membrane protein assembly factor BamB
LVLSLTVCALPAADWPQFRGPTADGKAPDTGLNKDWKAKPPKELWRIALSDGGYAGPSVANGKLFIIDHVGAEDVVRAITIADGKEAWTFKYADAGNNNYGFSRTTPIYDNGKLYTLSRIGNLNCLDAEKGTKIWSRNIKADFKGVLGSWEYAASPLVDGKNVIVCPGGANASVVALDKETGKDVWKGGGSDQAGYSTPVLATIGDKRQYVVFTGEGLVGVETTSGALLWKFPWATAHKVNAAAPIVIGDTIFISSGYGTGCAVVKIENNTPKQVWVNKEIKAHFSSAILHDKLIYGTGDPGELVCLDPVSGASKWHQTGFEKGGIVSADGVLIALNGGQGDAIMVKLNSEKYEELGRCKPLGGQSWTAPIIADGKLFVRNGKALVALDLK